MCHPGAESSFKCETNNKQLTPESYMEVGCPGTWGLELPTPNPGSKNTPKACPTRNPTASPRPQKPPPAPAQAPVTQSQELSGNEQNDDTNEQLLTITIVINNNN